MNQFNFNSQICTDRIQSERLLALGLKKETADFYTPIKLNPDKGSLPCPPDFWTSDEPFIKKIREASIPAWSLDRLRELLPKKIQYDGPLCYRKYQLVITDDSVFYVSFEHNDWLLGYGQSLWESMLISIEWLINEELFNKEYLEEKK